MNTHGTLKRFALLAATLAVAASVEAQQVKMNCSLAHPFLQADRQQTTFLKVGLTGFDLRDTSRRVPVNVALVLDRSGSMSGTKLERAKEAAIAALQRLNRDDIVAIVTYDDTVRVIVPATKVSDREALESAIRRIESGGSTALFAGVSKGAEEVRKFLDRNRVNRIILLSDGLANVGPSSPGDLAELGTSLAREGMSVTTLGLGSDYNEDLMSRLARASDGNHAFIEDAKDLTRIFNCEFGDILSVVAKDVTVTIDCASGVRPVRALGRESSISGRRAVVGIQQLYAGQEKYVLLEIEVPPGRDGSSRDVATVTVSYANMATRVSDRLTSTLSALFTRSEDKVSSAVEKEVMAAALLQTATERNRMAVELRDKGEIDKARDLLTLNAKLLVEAADKYKSAKLGEYGVRNDLDAQNLESAAWEKQRKSMYDDQYKNERQRSW
jgi:Ca-activated chloride channel homolog